MGYGRKARRQVKRRMAGMVDNDQADKMLEAGQHLLQANICRANDLLNEAIPKVADDMRAHYQAEVDRIRADYERQAKEQTEAYEDKCRREYDERTRIPKTQLKHEVIGDIMIMTLWVLMDKEGFDRERLHHYLHEFFRLEAAMQEPKLGVTINDIVNQMKEEGYDMQEDVELIDELVDAEMERYTELQGQPYVPRGSIRDKWRAGEEKRMKRLLLQGVNYLTVGLILGRSEGACKTRAKKLWGTTDAEKLRELFAEEAKEDAA